ncbi:MAG: hypothetical protein ACR2PF_21080 [Rhizobiaceae bacterium]
MTNSSSMSAASFVGKIALTMVIYGAATLFILANFVSSSEPGGGPDKHGQSAARSDAARHNQVVDKLPQTIEAKAAAWAATSKSCVIALNDGAPHGVSINGLPFPQIDDCTLPSIHGIVASISNGDDEEPLRLLAIDRPHYDGPHYTGVVANRIPTPAFRPQEANDPLEVLTTRAGNQCDHRNLTLKRGDYSLLPGVYCGGIIALNASRINLEPGIYVIKDGPFYLGGTSSLSGMNVGFIFKGRNAVFGSGVSTSVKLAAAAEGPMSDFLFIQDRHASPNSEFVIRSFDQQILVGTLYLPKGNLMLEMVDPEAQLPKSTSVVANQIEVKNIHPVATKNALAIHKSQKNPRSRRVAYAEN